jgi:LL-diaminopimelate aminotransferase
MKKTNRISKTPKYLFAEIDKKKAAAIARGVDLIDLSIGDPDQPTPKYIIDSMKKALDDPSTHNYPPYEGTKDFRAAVSRWYKKRFDVDLNPDAEVMSLIGSKEGIAHMIFALIDPGDVSLIPDPSYPVYKVCTILAGGTPHMLPLKNENGFLPDLDSIAPETLKKAKLMFVNYPNNPTSAIAPRSFLEKAVKFCKKNDIVLCSDLAYSEVCFGDYRAESILQIPGAKDIAVEFHSLSKTFNMTGWRIGMAVGNKEAVKALAIIKTNVDSGAFKAIQKAAIDALNGPEDFTGKMNGIYEKRMTALVDGLNSLGWKIDYTKATFYIWLPVPKGQTSASFCETLLEKCGVLVVPGSGYGESGEGYVRFCITADEARIKEAVSRMKAEGIRGDQI